MASVPLDKPGGFNTACLYPDVVCFGCIESLPWDGVRIMQQIRYTGRSLDH